MPALAPPAVRDPRRVSPAVFVAASLVGSIPLLLHGGRLVTGLLIAVLAGGAAAGTLLLLPAALAAPGGRAVAVALLCLALGGGTAAARLWPFLAAGSPERRDGRGEVGSLPVGLPLTQVRRYEAILRRDSSAAPGQATRYDLRLTRVLTAASERAAACSAEAVLWVQGGPRLQAGRRVVVEAPLLPAQAGRWPALSSTAAPEALAVGEYRSALHAARAGLLGAARRRMGNLEPATAATLEALVLGSREEIATELYGGFRASGSLHLLALSGLHAGILFVLARAALRFVRPPAVRSLAAAVVLLGYLFLAGFRPSLFRAVVMILTAAMARLLDRDARPVNLLALAAVALALIEPGAVLSLSFQLSFLAVAGILILSPGLQSWLERALPRPLAAAAAYSLAAQAATAPLLFTRFGVLHPIGIVAALALIPLVTLFIWAGLAYLLVAGSPLGAAAALGLVALHRLLQGSVALFARVPPLFGASAVALTAALLGASLAFRLRRAPALQIQ